jgi:hypothetical protein
VADALGCGIISIRSDSHHRQSHGVNAKSGLFRGRPTSRNPLRLGQHPALPHQLEERPPRLAAGAGGGGDVAAGAAERAFEIGAFELAHQLPLQRVERAGLRERIHRQAVVRLALSEQWQIGGIDRPRELQAGEVFDAVLELANVGRRSRI